MPEADCTLRFRGNCGYGLGPFAKVIDVRQGFVHGAWVTGQGFSHSSKGYPSHARTRIVAGGRHIIVTAFLSACRVGKPYDVWFNITYHYGNIPGLPEGSATGSQEEIKADGIPVDNGVQDLGSEISINSLQCPHSLYP